MIVTRDLSYQYPKGEAFEFPDISCSARDQLLVLGSSGVGKSTLLHILGGLITAQQGAIMLDGQDLSAMSARKLDRFRGEHIGIIFQQNHFIAALNVFENLKYAQYFAGASVDEEKCLSLLDRLNIREKAFASIRTLSEGQKQRVAIARALVNRPKLILADEPTSALDDGNCEEVIQLLEEQATLADAALIIVTHDSRLKSIVSQQIVLD